ncbi:hypothetical protein ZHAS_00009061 [Anopheles sinensis]|uniref:Uncharacterized protein n=1 Tax=Anopheles sinensis TaxID=74873 RepID=A0A084VU26_ANOSI|nr:hypothetical protein ZHAS_00009061 [Anopheles sinensis]
MSAFNHSEPDGPVREEKDGEWKHKWMLIAARAVYHCLAIFPWALTLFNLEPVELYERQFDILRACFEDSSILVLVDLKEEPAGSTLV